MTAPRRTTAVSKEVESDREFSRLAKRMGIALLVAGIVLAVITILVILAWRFTLTASAAPAATLQASVSIRDSSAADR